MVEATFEQAYPIAARAAKVRSTAVPVATYFCRFPTTCPLVRVTEPDDEMARK